MKLRAAAPWLGGLGLLLLSPGFGCSIYGSELLDGDSSSSGGASSGGSGSGGEEGPGGASSSGGAGSGGSESGGSGGEPRVELELIDDMEDNNASIRVTKGRSGRWNVYNDETPEGVQEPAVDFSTMHALDGDAPHPASTRSAYTKGSGFQVWGAALNVTLRSGPSYEEQPPYDATAYAGLAFYAKVGPGSVRQLRLRAVTTDTDPRGGGCDADDSDPELGPCFDHFLTEFDLTEEWAWYEIPFSDFSQQGFGQSYDAVQLGGVFAFEFVASQGVDFELWVDDISFILK